MSKEILINQLFAGKYLDEGKNIGHEAINFFKDDEGYNNIYITPSGNVKGHELEAVLFVRNVANRRTVEIIALAQNIRKISENEMKHVKYAGVSIADIFKNNIYHGEDEKLNDNTCFRAEKYYMPNKSIYLSLDNEIGFDADVWKLDSKKKVIISQGMRSYYSESEDVYAYKQLKELILDRELWVENTTDKLISEGIIYNQVPTFLEVIRKEDDENIFSNLFSYFFEYSHQMFIKFAEDILGIPNMSSAFVIVREKKYRVDIWIESEKDILVIENKIKSGINGVKDDSSQLNDYVIEAGNEAEKKNKRLHCFIFAPDYAKFDLSKFHLEDEYKVIRYSDVYQFFLRESETYMGDRAFPDFIRGLKRHTLSLPRLRFETMRSRLLKKIGQLQ